ncbi:MerR family transcriptional regulator, partial [Enterococcus faecium]
GATLAFSIESAVESVVARLLGDLITRDAEAAGE